MRQLQSVLWTKGVLLNPQHLQVQDRYLEDKLHLHLASLAFCPWGFVTLEMDEEALAGGEVRMRRGAGIFPDGLLFDISGPDDPTPPRALESHWTPDRDALTIFLAIPGQVMDGRNVSSEGGDRSARYSPKVLTVADENTGRAERDILVARKNFRLLIEREAAEGSSILPVARVLRDEKGELSYDSRFVPPAIDISASRHLMSIAQRLLENLSARSDDLSRQRKARNASLAEFGRSDVAHFWLLYVVNSFLPLLKHMVEGVKDGGGAAGPRLERAHPAELYRTMSELAGSLMTFSSDRHPKDLPPYEHGRLAACFEALSAELDDLLQTAVPSNCVTLRFRATEPSVHTVTIETDEQAAAIQAYLAVTTPMDQAKFIDKAPDWIKVASRDQLDELLRQAVRGIELSHTPNPPGSLAVRAGSQYFRLETVGPRWASVLQSRSLAVWVAADVPEPELELVLLLPADA